MDQLVETPVEAGPPKNQQVITHFFARERALEKMKLLASQDRRGEKGLNWYSEMKKSPEELRIIRRDLQRQMEIKRRKDAANRARRVSKEKEKEAKAKRQDEKDKKGAQKLYNKSYKDDLEMR
jgi:hypothetical protein